MLFGREVNQDEGYFANCGDVEHAGEFTSYPLFALLPTNFGRPSHIDFATRSIRNMDDQVDPAPWTGLLAAEPPPLQVLHLRCHLGVRPGARHPVQHPRDHPRLLPDGLQQRAAGEAAVRRAGASVGRGRGQHRRGETEGRPAGLGLGLRPAGVRHRRPVVDQQRLLRPAQWQSSTYSYLYGLFLAAYHNSTANDRHLLLEPILHAGLLEYQNSQNQLTSTLAGTYIFYTPPAPP